MTEKQSPTEVTVNVNLPTHQSAVSPLVTEPRSMGIAYLLWVLGGVFGLHRFYMGQRHGVTMLVLAVVGVLTTPLLLGLLPLMILAMWVLVDAALIPGWVDKSRSAALTTGAVQTRPAAPSVPAPAPAPSLPPARPDSLQMQLLKAAMDRKGVLTVTEGVIATGKSFKEVEACLRRMVDSGYVDIDNRPGSGVITYVFTELRD